MIMKTIIIKFFAALILFSCLFTSQISHASDAIGTVPQDVIDSLASGNIVEATLLLREAKQDKKVLYLMKESSRLAAFKIEGKPKGDNAYGVYKNVAIAYHNLYLFLKTNGIAQDKFHREAVKYYGKARKLGSKLDAEDCTVLEAALIAASGNEKKALKKFGKVEAAILSGNFESSEHLAVYYAAVGDIEGAIEALGDAYNADPNRTLGWIMVGDDFYNIMDNPIFASFLESMKQRYKPDEVTLSLPPDKEPSFQLDETTGTFGSQKSLPKLKKKRRKAKKKSLPKKDTAPKKADLWRAPPLEMFFEIG